MGFTPNNLMEDNPPAQGKVKSHTTETVTYCGEEGKKMFNEMQEGIRASIRESLGECADMTLTQIIEKSDAVRAVKKEKSTEIEIEYKRFKFKLRIKDKKKKKNKEKE